MLARWGGSLKIFTEDIEYMNCQLFVKCQKFKHLDYALGSKKKLDIMRLRHNEVNFEVKLDIHRNTPKS